MVKYFIRLILFTAFFIILTSCSSSKRFADKGNIESRYENLNENKSNEVEVGEASYYAKEFNGRTTANGEIYNMNDLTAAHPSYPFNTIVRVTNLTNEQSVQVRINDRMPNFKGRIIDLSLAAAKKIGIINSGVEKVKVEVLKWGNN
jgi:rare lipoprotein A